MPREKRSATQSASEGKENVKTLRLDLRGIMAKSVVSKLKDLAKSGAVQEDELDIKSLEKLIGFPPSEALAVLQKLESSDLSNVRNKSAYFNGIMSQYRKDRPAGPNNVAGVFQHMLQLQATGQLRWDHIDGRCLEALEELPPHVGFQVLDAFVSKDLTTARNPPALFMVTIRHVERNAGGPPARILPARNADIGQPRLERPRENIRLSQPMPTFNNMSSFSISDMSQPIMSMPPVSAPPTNFDMFSNRGRDSLDTHTSPESMPANRKLMGRTYYGVEQLTYGVRINEFHTLSLVAPYVHPAVALKLQQLWDSGVRLVALLDDDVWDCLVSLGAPEALVVIEGLASRFPGNETSERVSAIFMNLAAPFLKTRNPMLPGKVDSGPSSLSMSSFGGNQQFSQMKPDFGMQSTPAMSGYGSQSTQYMGSNTNVGMGLSERQTNYTGAMQGHGEGPNSMQARGPASQMPSGRSPLDALSPNLRAQVEDVIRIHNRYLTYATFDERIVSQLASLRIRDAEAVIEDLRRSDLSKVRTMSAFIVGMIRRQCNG